MDLFEAPYFAAALPDDFELFDEIPGPVAPQPALRVQEMRYDGPGIRELTRQQWEILKPLIQRVYIEENKPFPHLVKILREEHGFEPTKRQFSIKVREWGFRKNVSRSERQRILPTLPRSMNEPVPNLQDWRLPPRKLKNWQRRYRNEAAQVSAFALQQEHQRGDFAFLSTFRSVIHKAYADHNNDPDEIVLEEAAQLSAATTPAPPAQETKDSSEESEHTPLNSAIDMSQDSWQFDWSTVDVPGSPGLTRLFSALQIEVTKSVPPMSLDATDSDEMQCISSNEIARITNDRSNVEHDGTVDIYSTRHWENAARIGVESSHQPHYPWRDINTAFWGYDPSPFNEVYVFPPSKPATRQATASCMSVWETAEVREAQLETRYRKLKRQLRANDPTIIVVMEELAVIYWTLDKYKRAERMFRNLVDIYRKSSTSRQHRVLQACIDVVDCIKMRGFYRKAQLMIQSLRPALLKLVPLDHPLSMGLMETEAEIALQLDEKEKAESLCREVLQIRLGSSGARSSGTIRAILNLACTMSGEEMTSRASRETLMQNAVQLAFDDQASDEELRSQAIWSLLLVKSTEEAYNIATNALERFRDTLGLHHLNILRIQRNLAWNMMKLGNLHESENLHRVLVSTLDSWQEDVGIQTATNSYYGLAVVLERLGNWNEAAIWYEKALEGSLICYGADDRLTQNDCFNLASCYEKLGRYKDAVKLYHQMIDEIRKSGEDKHGAITKLESTISRLQEWMEKSTSESSSIDDESGQEEEKSNDKPDDELWDEGIDSNADADVVEEASHETGISETNMKETDLRITEEAEEREDWMVFINEEVSTFSSTTTSSFPPEL